MDNDPQPQPLTNGDQTLDHSPWTRHIPYLRLLADRALPNAARGRLDPSDIVQQTLTEAWRCRAQFRGEGQAEWLAWVRAILKNVAAAAARHHLGTGQRDAAREIRISQAVDQTSLRLENLLAAQGAGPASEAAHRERAAIVAEALARLPVDYQQVLIWRHFDDLPHAEIAQRLGRSEPAARMLWARALSALRREVRSA